MHLQRDLQILREAMEAEVQALEKTRRRRTRTMTCRPGMGCPWTGP